MDTASNNGLTFTNMLLVIVLLLLVGFGVWYLAEGSRAPVPAENPGGLNVNIEGTLPGGTGGESPDDGTPDQGSGDN